MSCFYGDKTGGGGGGVFKGHSCRQTVQDKLKSFVTETLSSMYIKFCRSYGKDKKDETCANLSPESGLSVELEGEKDKQTGGNTRLYRAACIFLTIMCLVLLLIVIILGLQLQTGSTVCPEIEEVAADDRPGLAFAPTCNQEQCKAHFPGIQHQYRRCQQCADGWLKFGQSCFFLSTFRLSWDESQRNCRAKGGSLAVISSTRVQHFLTNVGKMNYWIGLRWNRDTWTWINDTVIQESYWVEVKSDGDCGILSSGNPPEKNWDTASCKAYTYFICQLQL